jgi:hypothetical protein
LAFASPQSSGQIITEWSPAATPWRRCPSIRRAFVEATLMSASRPTARPDPMASPLIAETTGLSQLTMPCALTRPFPNEVDDAVVAARALEHLLDAVAAFNRPELVSPAGDDRDARTGVVVEVPPDPADLRVAPGQRGGRVSFGLCDRDQQDPVLASVDRQRLVLAPVDAGTLVVVGH